MDAAIKSLLLNLLAEPEKWTYRKNGYDQFDDWGNFKPVEYECFCLKKGSIEVQIIRHLLFGIKKSDNRNAIRIYDKYEVVKLYEFTDELDKALDKVRDARCIEARISKLLAKDNLDFSARLKDSKSWIFEEGKGSDAFLARTNIKDTRISISKEDCVSGYTIGITCKGEGEVFKVEYLGDSLYKELRDAEKLWRSRNEQVKYNKSTETALNILRKLK